MLQIAYYQAPIATFLKTHHDQILGELSRGHTFDLDGNQRDAWLVQIELLQRELTGITDGDIYFEFSIPRMGKRADVVVLRQGVVFVLEFKVGSSTFDRAAIEQAHDYALDLKNFHRGSHDLPVVPVLIATRAPEQAEAVFDWAPDRVATPIMHTGKGLAQFLDTAVSNAPISAKADSDWATSGYLPTPTIIEAAQALYQNHSVDEIARSDAGAQNLNATSKCLEQIIDTARKTGTKAICFVTGVPGSGKTLVGLNVATQTAEEDTENKAVFLSGNGPLVTVLREALARDQKDRTGCTKKDASREVASFVQNIHHFRDEALRDQNAPAEHIVIFDEAQRAWNRDQASKFMQSKRGIAGFDQSEPDFLISVMDRHDDWCVIVCLVGGGQEINTGEAGLGEWVNALTMHYGDWDIHLSDRLTDPHYGLQDMATPLKERPRTYWEPNLHLSVSMRSFRAEALSEFIGYVLDNKPALAAEAYQTIKDRYPIAMTRDINTARAWLLKRSRGTERHGLVASSGAHRLRPEGVNVRSSIDPANWFLNDRSDVRSAYYLEEVATEFDIQGLEIDWACVCWDADLRYENGQWASYAFKGTKWQNVNAVTRQLYLQNAYRVILTRARQGMIIFVPKGDERDATRPPAYYDETARYLCECGLVSADLFC